MRTKKSETKRKVTLKELSDAVVKASAECFELKPEYFKTTITGRDEKVYVEITNERDQLDITFDYMSRISDIFNGTKLIDIAQQDEYGGCETCGHGAVYVVRLRVGMDKVEITDLK